MSFLLWNESFDVHLDHLNEEHKELFRLVNLLYQQNTNKQGMLVLRQTFLELINFTVQHFQDEETYMLEINFPELETHRLMHRRLLNKLKEFLIKFEQGEGEIIQEFLTFIKMWLSSHIKGIDMKFATETITE